jgi:hypothetical protein
MAGVTIIMSTHYSASAHGLCCCTCWCVCTPVFCANTNSRTATAMLAPAAVAEVSRGDKPSTVKAWGIQVLRQDWGLGAQGYSGSE